MVSDNARSGMQQAPARSLFNALGFTAEEMKKPMIGIVSSYNEIVPGHMNIDKIVNAPDYGDNNLVIEIGPGAGALTKELLKKVDRAILYEVDTRLEKILNKERIQAKRLKKCPMFCRNHNYTPCHCITTTHSFGWQVP